MKVTIRTNGRGNAWPQELGEPADPRQRALATDAYEHANTSFSILGGSDGQDWQVLFDVGLGLGPFLVNEGARRLPDVLVISHPHLDHFGGADAVVAAQRRYCSGKRLPLYCSRPTWRRFLDTFGYLEPHLEFRPLIPGVAAAIPEAPGLWITGFPVFHGETAPGAIMAQFAFDAASGEKPVRAIFSGDLLCPLLRPCDVEEMRTAKVLYVDANNKFPAPRSGHWSITSGDHCLEPEQSLAHWFAEGRASLSYLMSPHLHGWDKDTCRYFDEFVGWHHGADPRSALAWTILRFVENVAPATVKLVHISQYEDLRHYGAEVLEDRRLEQFAWDNWERLGGSSGHVSNNVQFRVPRPGDLFQLHP